eukprot:4440403-Pyramimonas_sp.AAC.1
MSERDVRNVLLALGARFISENIRRHKQLARFSRIMKVPPLAWAGLTSCRVELECDTDGTV